MEKKRIKIGFDLWKGVSPNIFKSYLFYKLLNKHYEISFDFIKPDIFFYSVFNQTSFKNYNCLKIKIVGESNLHDENAKYEIGMDYDYSLTNNNYFYFPLYLLQLDINKKENEHKDFCCFLVSNKRAVERKDFFEYLNSYKHVNSGGKVLNNIGYIVPKDKTDDFFSKHKFSISFENTSSNGYLTEKIFVSLYNGCIPIYWGDPLVENIINPNRFINANKLTKEEILEKVKEIDNDDNLYKSIINEPILVNPNYWEEVTKRLEEYLVNIIEDNLFTNKG